MKTHRWAVESLETRSMLTTIFVAEAAVGGDGSANSPFGTIQEAVDFAASTESPGDDTIKVAAGVYEENVVIDDDDAVNLSGQGDVIIKHRQEIPVDDEGNPDPDDIIEAKGDVTFQNLSIEGPNLGGDYGGRGIDAQDGSFAFTNVDISGTDGDAVRVRDFGSLEIQIAAFPHSTPMG